MGGARALGRGVPAACEGAAAPPAANDRRDSVAACERGQVARDFIRWSRLGVWERLLVLTQARGVQLGMTFLDGTSVRAHQKAAGAAAKGATRRDRARLRRLAALVAAMAPKPA